MAEDCAVNLMQVDVNKLMDENDAAESAEWQITIAPFQVTLAEETKSASGNQVEVITNQQQESLEDQANIDAVADKKRRASIAKNSMLGKLRKLGEEFMSLKKEKDRFWLGRN